MESTGVGVGVVQEGALAFVNVACGAVVLDGRVVASAVEFGGSEDEEDEGVAVAGGLLEGGLEADEAGVVVGTLDDVGGGGVVLTSVVVGAPEVEFGMTVMMVGACVVFGGVVGASVVVAAVVVGTAVVVGGGGCTTVGVTVTLSERLTLNCSLRVWVAVALLVIVIVCVGTIGGVSVALSERLALNRCVRLVVPVMDAVCVVTATITVFVAVVPLSEALPEVQSLTVCAAEHETRLMGRCFDRMECIVLFLMVLFAQHKAVLS